MAAQDTTYVLLSNTLFLLSRHPAVYEKLRAEVRNFDLDVRPGLFDDLRGLKFLRNIICECKLCNLTLLPQALADFQK